MTKKLTIFALSVLVAVVAFTGFVGSEEAEAKRSGNTIYDTAMYVNSMNGEFSYLLKALELTGLDAAVDGQRQLTVFAPTDEAFENALGISDPMDLESVDVNVLTNILLYHVSPGNRDAVAVTSSTQVRTLNKMFIMVEGTVLNGSVNIVQADVFAANGVVHVIDDVLMPM